jgi:hypothetical protein
MGECGNIGRDDKNLESVSVTSMLQNYCCTLAVFLEPVDLIYRSERNTQRPFYYKGFSLLVATECGEYITFCSSPSDLNVNGGFVATRCS